MQSLMTFCLMLVSWIVVRAAALDEA